LFNVGMLVFKKDGSALRSRGRGTWLSRSLLVPVSLSMESVHAVRRLDGEMGSKGIRKDGRKKIEITCGGRYLVEMHHGGSWEEEMQRERANVE